MLRALREGRAPAQRPGQALLAGGRGGPRAVAHVPRGQRGLGDGRSIVLGDEECAEHPRPRARQAALTALPAYFAKIIGPCTSAPAELTT